MPTAGFTALSFLNVTRYLPSLLFLLLTLGPALIPRARRPRHPALSRPALLIGKVPLFYYALHFAAIHLLAMAVCYLRDGSARPSGHCHNDERLVRHIGCGRSLG